VIEYYQGAHIIFYVSFSQFDLNLGKILLRNCGCIGERQDKNMRECTNPNFIENVL
jgi:hypothetical protein